MCVYGWIRALNSQCSVTQVRGSVGVRGLSVRNTGIYVRLGSPKQTCRFSARALHSQVTCCSPLCSQGDFGEAGPAGSSVSALRAGGRVAAALGKDKVGGAAHSRRDDGPGWCLLLAQAGAGHHTCFVLFCCFYDIGATRTSGTHRNQRGKGEYGDISHPTAWVNFPNTSHLILRQALRGSLMSEGPS